MSSVLFVVFLLLLSHELTTADSLATIKAKGVVPMHSMERSDELQ